MADFTAGAVLTAAQLDTAFNTFTINAQTGTTYTLGAADAGELVTVNNNSGGTVTIPANATVAYETGTHIGILNAGTAGTFTVAAAGGVTLNADVATLATKKAATLVKTATNTWYLLPFSSGSAAPTVSGTTGSPATGTGKDGRAMYTYTGNGTITFSTTGTVRVLVVGGGRAGSGGTTNGGGGGLVSDVQVDVTAATYDITVGAGGVYLGGTGGTSTFSSAQRPVVRATGALDYDTGNGNITAATSLGVLTDISGSSVGYGGAGWSTTNAANYSSTYGGAQQSVTQARANSGGGGNEVGTGNGAAGIVIVLA